MNSNPNEHEAEDYSLELEKLHKLRKRFIGQLVRCYDSILTGCYEQPVDRAEMPATEQQKLQVDLDRLNKYFGEVSNLISDIQEDEYEEDSDDDEEDSSTSDPRVNIIKSAPSNVQPNQ